MLTPLWGGSWAGRGELQEGPQGADQRAPGEGRAEGGGGLQRHPAACWMRRHSPEGRQDRCFSSRSSHFRPWTETSVPRLADHDMCLCKGFSAGLEARETGPLLCSTWVFCLCSSVLSISAREKPPAIILHPAGDTATPGGPWAPSQGDLRGPAVGRALVLAPRRASGLLSSSIPPGTKIHHFPPAQSPWALGTTGDKEMSLVRIQYHSTQGLLGAWPGCAVVALG